MRLHSQYTIELPSAEIKNWNGKYRFWSNRQPGSVSATTVVVPTVDVIWATLIHSSYHLVTSDCVHRGCKQRCRATSSSKTTCCRCHRLMWWKWPVHFSMRPHDNFVSNFKPDRVKLFNAYSSSSSSWSLHDDIFAKHSEIFTCLIGFITCTMTMSTHSHIHNFLIFGAPKNLHQIYIELIKL